MPHHICQCLCVYATSSLHRFRLFNVFRVVRSCLFLVTALTDSELARSFVLSCVCFIMVSPSALLSSSVSVSCLFHSSPHRCSRFVVSCVSLGFLQPSSWLCIILGSLLVSILFAFLYVSRCSQVAPPDTRRTIDKSPEDPARSDVLPWRTERYKFKRVSPMTVDFT